MPNLFLFKWFKVGLTIAHLFIFGITAGYSAPKTIEVEGNKELVYFYTAGYITYIEDTSQTPDLYKAITWFKNGRYKKPALENQLGISNHGYWIAIPISNVSNHEARLNLEMQNLHVNEMRFHVLSADYYLLKSNHSGDILPFKQRPKQVRNFVFPFEITPHSSVICLIYLKNRGENVSLPLFLHDQESYPRSESLFILLLFMTIGILMAMGLWALALFAKRLESTYFNYFLYILGLISWMLSNYGIGYMFIWPDYPIWQQILPSFLGLTSFLLFMNFSYGFLKVGTWKSWLKWGYWLVFAGGISVQLILLSYPIISKKMPDIWILEILMVCMLVSQFVMIYTIVMILRRKLTTSLTLFSLAYLSAVISGLTVLLREMIPMPVNIITEHGMMLGWVGEAVLLAFSIASMLENQLRERHLLLKNQQQHQKDLLSAEVKTREEEAVRIAADLHDDMGMLLTTAHHFVSHHKFEESRKIIVQCMEKVRQITHSLHPTEVNAFGLGKVLEEMTSGLSTEETTIKYSNLLPFNLKNEKAVTIYRCISEILTNTLRHAHATLIRINLRYIDERVEIDIWDNGIGFEIKEQTNKGLGLKNVESRIQYLNGGFKLVSHLGKGTHITLSIPYDDISLSKI